MKDESKAHTREMILPLFAAIINNWKKEAGYPKGYKIAAGFWGSFFVNMVLSRGMEIPEYEKGLIENSIKFVDQWLFIGKNLNFVRIASMQLPHILRRARGKFLPWSECDKFKIFNT